MSVCISGHREIVHNSCVLYIDVYITHLFSVDRQRGRRCGRAPSVSNAIISTITAQIQSANENKHKHKNKITTTTTTTSKLTAAEVIAVAAAAVAVDKKVSIQFSVAVELFN